jgi:putative PIN family toxin of toxin-antitoxin system
LTRLVLDTNVAVAGLLWSNHSRRLLDLAADETVSLYSSPALIDELAHTLAYPKLARRLAVLDTTPDVLLARYSALVSMVSPEQVPRVIAHDADDDQVLACALTAQAGLIVSGDKHLLSLGGHYNGIPILTPAQAVQQIAR